MAYTITEDCINCDACRPECPTESVSVGDDTYVIDANTCVECVDEATCGVRLAMKEVRDATARILDHTTLASVNARVARKRPKSS